MEPLLLTADGARRLLGVSERGLHHLIKRGLPFIIVGRRKMFPASDIKTWISEQSKRSVISTHPEVEQTKKRRPQRGRFKRLLAGVMDELD